MTSGNERGTGAGQAALARMFDEARACRHCADILPLGPRPVLRGSATARLLIISQAPGTRVHASGLSFDDRSGDRLRDWLGFDRATFYDESRVAILPMGLCYPGVDSRGGDRPPIPACAPLWHPRILPLLPEIRLTLLVGSYAVRVYLPDATSDGLWTIVRRASGYLPRFMPLPHPSWRNTAQFSRHLWFESETLPILRQAITKLWD